MAYPGLTPRQQKALDELEEKGEVHICWDYAEPTLQALVDHGLAHWKYPGGFKQRYLVKTRIQTTPAPDEDADRQADREAIIAERRLL